MNIYGDLGGMRMFILDGVEYYCMPQVYCQIVPLTNDPKFTRDYVEKHFKVSDYEGEVLGDGDERKRRLLEFPPDFKRTTDRFFETSTIDDIMDC